MKNPGLKDDSEKTLHKILKEASDYKYAPEESCIVAITDQKGIIIYANNSFCEISKFSRDELIGQDHRVINSGFHSKDFMHKLWVTIANGGRWKGELKNKAKDGTAFWVDTIIVPLLNKKGDSYEYIAISSDITRKKDLEEKQELCSSIINSAEDAIFTENKVGIITTWNQGAEKIFGYSSIEIIGKNISVLIPPHLHNEEKEIMEKILRNEPVDHYETERLRKDGRHIFLSLTVSPVKDLFGNIIGFSRISRDITERKEARKKLITSEEQFHHTLDNMLEGIQIHDFNWRYIYVNEALIKYSSYTKEELLGYTIMEKYPGIEQTDLFNTMQRCMNERVAEQLETEFVFPDKTKAYYELSIRPIPEGIFILSIDRSEQKKAKEKLMKVNRLYAFVSAVNQSVVHINDECELLNNACNIAVDIGQFKVAWIDMVDEQSGKLNIVSLSGEKVAIEKTKEHSGMDCNNPLIRNSPSGKALSTGRYALINDVQNDPAMSSLKKQLVQNEIKSCISLPIKKYGKVVGIFGLHSTVKDFFDEEEITLLEEATEDISFALEIIEKAKEHRLTEELIIHNEKRFRALIEKSADMKMLSEQNGKLIYTSPSIKKVLGYTIEESLHLPPFSFIHPDEMTEFLKRRSEILKAPGKSLNFQYRFRHKSGRWIWCEGTLTNMLHEPGVHAMVTNFIDISERKTAELAQIESKNLIQAIYTASIDAVIIINKEGLIVKWDAKSENLFGWMEKDVMGTKLSETIIPERYREMHEQGIKHYFKTKEGPILGKTINISALKRNGDEFDVSLSITPSNINGEIHFIGFIRDISEIKKAEQQQEFNKNNLDALINNTKDLMWSVDKNAKLITFNQPFFEIIRTVSGKELAKGDDIYSVVLSPEQMSRFKIFYARAFGGEAFTETEYIASPVESWSEISYYPIRKGNEVIGTACHSRDITERKKAEESIRQNEKRLKESQEVAHLGNWELNFETNESLWSDEALRIYGLTPQENNLSYERWASFIHPDDFDYVMAANKESQKTLSRTYLNHRIILKDGTVKHIHSESRFEFDKDGKPVGLYGITQDVTEMKITGENLRISESSLKEAQAIAQVGNWTIDLVHNIHAWSDELYNIFRINKEELTPSLELFLSLIHPDDFNLVYEKIGEAFKNIKNPFFDFKFLRKDGVLRYGYSEWKFELDKNKNPIRLFGIVQDVTERKLAETERIKMVNDLMQRNKDLEQFAYIVSHNLRAPVANILGALGALNNPGLSSENKNVLSNGLNESVLRLDNVVKDLNHVLKVKGKVNETYQKVLFSTLVDDIKISIKNWIDRDNIEINCDFSEIDDFLTLKSYLYSIFYNLITNSIKYRRQQAPCKIDIKSRLANNKIELIFTDNGMGIDLIKRGDQVFGLYKRFHLNIEGKGMGLFMVKTQVETLGGKISITSEVNKGTEFKIEFEK